MPSALHSMVTCKPPLPNDFAKGKPSRSVVEVRPAPHVAARLALVFGDILRNVSCYPLMTFDRREADIPESIPIIRKVEISVFVDNKTFGRKSVHQPVSMPSPVVVLFGNDKVLQFAPVSLVIILNPVPQILDPLLKVESVLLFFA